MFKILFGAIYRRDFFDKGFSGDYPGSLGCPPLIAVFGINLSDPAGIPITGHPDENLGVEVAEMEGFRIGLGIGRHEFSLKGKWGVAQMDRGGFRGTFDIQFISVH